MVERSFGNRNEDIYTKRHTYSSDTIIKCMLNGPSGRQGHYMPDDEHLFLVNVVYVIPNAAEEGRIYSDDEKGILVALSLYTRR